MIAEYYIPKDKELKILNLTDLHIGGGWGSIQTDRDNILALFLFSVKMRRRA